MKKYFQSQVITAGLAIFSMLFGAGNLIYPLEAGLLAGSNNSIGILGFILTAVLLPIFGLVAMIFFDGNYTAFFDRLGKKVGAILVCTCMLIIGPFLAIPRIATLSHEMIGPFLPIPFFQTITPYSSFVFATLFLGITFILTFRENQIVKILGNIISPILLISLIIIIMKGMLSAQTAIKNTQSPLNVFKTNLLKGYETLDLLGMIFFASIVLSILHKTWGRTANKKQLALIGLKAGLIGSSLLGLVYIGMSFLAAYHGQGLVVDGLFRELSLKILGFYGAIIIGIAVLMACFSTSIALGAVVSEYVQRTLFRNKITFVQSLALVLISSLPLSTFGLNQVRALTGGPLVYIGYPVIIAITFCNIAYKLFGFRPIKIPVLLTFVIAFISYIR